MGQHHWLELDNNPTEQYIELFMQDKIVWSDISVKPTFSFLKAGTFITNTCYMITPIQKHLICILNSKLVEYYMNKTAAQLGTKSDRYFKIYVQEIPVYLKSLENEKMIELETLADLLSSTEKTKTESETRQLLEQVDRIVYDLYGLSKEEIRIIETNSSV